MLIRYAGGFSGNLAINRSFWLAEQAGPMKVSRIEYVRFFRINKRLFAGGLIVGIILLNPALAYTFSAATTPPAQTQAATNTPPEVFPIILELTAGLVLFLYGVSRLSIGLKKAAGERMKNLLARFTQNRFAGVLTGTAATTLLDSSSVTIIMVIALVNAGLLTFMQSLGVIMGANIGTTISSQIIALQINEYSPIALAIGFGLWFIGKSKRLKRVGLIVFGIGLVFFGLETMSKAVEPLQGYQPFIDWMVRMEKPLLGALVGAAVTVLIQSSSATLGIIITLASQNLISLPAGIALMLGAEIGTCADTLLASIGRSREAIRAGVFHLLFNVITVIIGVLFASQLAAFIKLISGNADVSRQIANAHVLFNVGGVLVFIWFVPWIARGLYRLVPESKPAASPQVEASKT